MWSKSRPVAGVAMTLSGSGMGSVGHLRLGSTGMEVSELCLGAWMFGSEISDGSEIVDEQTAHDLLDAAWAAGVNFIDTVNIYGQGRSERYIGTWLRGRDRENFVIASKVFFQLDDTLAAMELAVSPDQYRRIADAGALPELNPGVHSYV
jgi:aryl-alcohol dehydrogenase-like predicted oxidoreductase